MKIFKKYIVITLTAAALFNAIGCKKEFLEIVPKGQAIAINTSDYENILNANYITSQFTANVYLGDEMAAIQPGFNNMPAERGRRYRRLFQYEDRVYNADQLPDEVTDADNYIRKLYLFNKVINEVMDAQGGTESQKLSILAEAKVGRAICNFMFLSDFTKPYNQTTAATDLGIPNLTVADVTQKDFKRGTLQQAYDLILSDLKSSLPNLNILTHRRKISRLAAEFYLARVYMAMNNYPEAKIHVDAAFEEVSKSVIPMALYDYTVVLNPDDQDVPGTWFPDFGFGLMGEPLAVNNTQTIYNVTCRWFDPVSVDGIVFSPQTASLYAATDRRLNLYTTYSYSEDAEYPLSMRRRNTGFFTGIDVGPSIADLYLMRAECNARANNLSEAVSDLQILRTKRIPGSAAQVPTAVASDQQALVRFILDERIREFAISGLRWLDMRRLSQDPVFKNHIKLDHKVYNQAGTVVSTFTLRPERYALKFGERMLNESNGLEENP